MASENTDLLDDIMARACNVLRAGQARSVTVVLADRPDPEDAAALRARAVTCDLHLTISDLGVVRLRRQTTSRQPWHRRLQQAFGFRRGLRCATNQTVR